MVKKKRRKRKKQKKSETIYELITEGFKIISKGYLALLCIVIFLCCVAFIMNICGGHTFLDALLNILPGFIFGSVGIFGLLFILLPLLVIVVGGGLILLLGVPYIFVEGIAQIFNLGEKFKIIAYISIWVLVVGILFLNDPTNYYIKEFGVTESSIFQHGSLDKWAGCTITLQNNTKIFLREINELRCLKINQDKSVIYIISEYEDFYRSYYKVNDEEGQKWINEHNLEWVEE